MIIQRIVRIAFSFNAKKTHKYWAGLWGGFAITTILYFLLIKGADGSTLVTDDMLAFINEHTSRIMLFSFVGWTLIFQLLTLFTRVNVLKIIVLTGTFALAMAFAGNDLVNFIGVPLAGYESFKAFMASGSSDPGSFMMTALQEPVNTPLYFLIAAGIVMVLTLRFSKKARSVTATTIDLSRQSEGSERFASSSLARFLVRRAVETSNLTARIAPASITRFVESRFEAGIEHNKKDKGLAFDLVRASVNLVVASILIALGTSLKLPLSTTYVTFMVAMGTSLADGAWGRESAVYRITGVLTVIGGWFFTAFIAFLASFLMATLIFFGKLPVILILLALSIFILIRTHAFHRKRFEKQEWIESQNITDPQEILNSCNEDVKSSIIKVSKILYLTYVNFFKDKHKELKNLKKEARQLNKEFRKIKESIPETLRKFEDSELESGHFYVQVASYLKEMSNSLVHIIEPAFEHLNNNHPVDKEQSEPLKQFNQKSSEFFNFAINILKNKNFESIDELVIRRDELISMVNGILLNRIKILKKTQKGVKMSVTYMEMLNETKNLLLNLVHLVKADAQLLKSMAKGRKDIDVGLLE